MAKSHTFFFLLTIFCFSISAQTPKFISYYNKGDYIKALGACEKTLDKDYKNLDATLYKSLCYSKLAIDADTKADYYNGTEQALFTLLQLRKKDADNSYSISHAAVIDTILQIALNQFQLYNSKNKPKKASAILDKLCEWNLKPEYIYWQGKLLDADGDEPAAMDKYNEAAKLIYLQYKNGLIKQPYFPETFTALAHALFNQNQPELAFTIHNRIARLFHQDSLAHNYFEALEAYFNTLSNFSEPAEINMCFNYTDSLIYLYENKKTYSIFKQQIFAYWIALSVDRKDYSYTDSIITAYTCTRKDFEPEFSISKLEDAIIDKTHTEKYNPAAIAIDSRPLENIYIDILKKLNISPIERIEFYINNDSIIQAAKLLFNFSVTASNTPDVKKTLALLVDKIKNINQDVNYNSILLECYLLFPSDKNIKDYHYKNTVSIIEKLIREKKFSEAGKMVREFVKLYPTDAGAIKLEKLWVIEDYTYNYSSSYINDTINWHGDILTCNAGYLSDSIQAKFLQNLNYIRRLAGVPDESRLSKILNKKAQQAALMMDAQNDLSHTPDKNWHCYSADGYAGASHSNLSLGNSLTSALLSEVNDGGASNYFVGHRRWILFPSLKYFGLGSTNNAMALWVLGNYDVPSDSSYYTDTELQPYRTTFISWPPAGFVPSTFMCQRWSLAYPNADFSACTVEITSGGKKVMSTINPLAMGYGENTLVWEVPNIDYFYEKEITYSVSVKNIIIDNKQTNYTYIITFIPIIN